MADRSQDNPYASPQAEEEPGDAPAWDAWSRNGLIFTAPKSELPMRCWVCNAPATRRHLLRKTGWVTAQGLVNISVLWFYCDTHHARQKWRWPVPLLKVLLVLLLLQSGPVISAAVNAGSAGIVLALGVGIVLLVISLYAGARMADWIGRRPSIHEVTFAHIKLKGAGLAFLESLHRPR